MSIAINAASTAATMCIAYDPNAQTSKTKCLDLGTTNAVHAMVSQTSQTCAGQTSSGYKQKLEKTKAELDAVTSNPNLPSNVRNLAQKDSDHIAEQLRNLPQSSIPGKQKEFAHAYPVPFNNKTVDLSSQPPAPPAPAPAAADDNAAAIAAAVTAAAAADAAADTSNAAAAAAAIAAAAAADAARAPAKTDDKPSDNTVPNGFKAGDAETPTKPAAPTIVPPKGQPDDNTYNNMNALLSDAINASKNGVGFKDNPKINDLKSQLSNIVNDQSGKYDDSVKAKAMTALMCIEQTGNVSPSNPIAGDQMVAMQNALSVLAGKPEPLVVNGLPSVATFNDMTNKLDTALTNGGKFGDNQDVKDIKGQLWNISHDNTGKYDDSVKQKAMTAYYCLQNMAEPPTDDQVKGMHNAVQNLCGQAAPAPTSDTSIKPGAPKGTPGANTYFDMINQLTEIRRGGDPTKLKTQLMNIANDMSGNVDQSVKDKALLALKSLDVPQGQVTDNQQRAMEVAIQTLCGQ